MHAKLWRFPFKPSTLQPDLADLNWFEPATATKVDAITRCQMPSGTFHYYPCAKLDADAMCQIQMMRSPIVTAKVLFVL